MKEEIIEYIRSEFHGGNPEMQIDSDEDLLTSGIVESIAMMRIIQFIEESYDLRVGPKDMIIENFINVDAMVAYIKMKKS